MSEQDKKEIEIISSAESSPMEPDSASPVQYLQVSTPRRWFGQLVKYLPPPIFGDMFGIILVAMLLLRACFLVSEHKTLRSIADNDAIGYSLTARTFVETGNLDSKIIYPSTLSQKTSKSVLYMPGFYYTLAVYYKLFGFGPIQSLLVSSTSCIIAALCTYLIGRRYFNRPIALMAALFFLIYPPNLYFASTAMTELALVSASAIALCIFVHLPRKWMPFVGPILLLLPFMYRETGAFLVLPMAIIMLMPLPGEVGVLVPPFASRFRQALLLSVLSVISTGIVYISPVAAGRASLVKLDILVDEAAAERIYRDATLSDKLHPSKKEWAQILMKRFVENVKMMWTRSISQQKEFVIVCMLPLFFVIPIGLLMGGYKKNPILLSAALLTALILVFVCFCYSVRHDRPLRVTMYAYPLIALVEAQLIFGFYGISRRWLRADVLNWMMVLYAIGVLGWIGSTTYKGFRSMEAWDQSEERGRRFVEELHHDDKTMLVGPHLLGVPYINEHYPCRYSFVPANRQTLHLLVKKYPVTTLIYNPYDSLDLRNEDLEAEGLFLTRRIIMEDPLSGRAVYHIYRKPAYPGEELLWNPVGLEPFNWTPRRNLNY